MPRIPCIVYILCLRMLRIQDGIQLNTASIPRNSNVGQNPSKKLPLKNCKIVKLPLKLALLLVLNYQSYALIVIKLLNTASLPRNSNVGQNPLNNLPPKKSLKIVKISLNQLFWLSHQVTF